MFVQQLLFLLALGIVARQVAGDDGNGGSDGGDDKPMTPVDNCGCELPERNDTQRLCSSDINFLTHLKLVGDGSPRCHMPANVGPDDDSCMSVSYTFESTKVGQEIEISTTKMPGCELQPKPDVKYAISGNQFYKDVVQCDNIDAADIVLIVDDSGSVGSNRFNNEIKQFLQSLRIAVTPDTGASPVNFGIMSFSTTPQTLAPLAMGRTSAQIGALIAGMPYRGGFTDIVAALNHARDNVLVTPFDADANPNICIFIGDGNPTRGPRTVAAIGAASNSLQAECQTVFAIGVGNGINQNVLEAIASDADKAIRVDDFDKLTEALVDEITQSICLPTGETKKVCMVKPCNGIFKETDHDEFGTLLAEYERCHGTH